jgi:hypothetical protein
MTQTIDHTFVDAVRCRERICGLSHSFYRYPARFSPLFARAAIEAFTDHGDVVLDPFMGGGTTLVEACAAGRLAVGTDINSLAVFVSRVKTTPLSHQEINEVGEWVATLAAGLNLHRPVERDTTWIDLGYQKNINTRKTWPIRKLLEMSLPNLHLLRTEEQRRFARCVLLRTAQWALDCRKDIPSAAKFRVHLLVSLDEMKDGACEYAAAVGSPARGAAALCLHRSASEIHLDRNVNAMGAPKLIVTSPPYPGVHVLYHRWQVQGRRETPAPYWIANSLDGDGASFYTFGDRKQQNLTTYYDAALAAFTSIAQIARPDTTVVQMVAFSDSSWQLPEYLVMMQRAGFREIVFRDLSDSEDGRLWRAIPNRKFYADQKGETASSKEVVLFHRTD